MNVKCFVSARWIFQLNMHTAIILLTVAAISYTQEDGISPLQVQTTSGPVEGIAVTVDDQHAVNVYYGIPYAQPPVGNLRFQPPKKVTPWTSVLKANKPSPMCYQQIPRQLASSKEMPLLIPRPWSEDCLTLNIWTPSPKPEKAPVIAFIHGGAYILGSSLLFIDGTIMTLDGVVVVSMNYRLGAFGFFSLGISDAPGNMGLMDQNLALRWIKDNIEAFGGDPESITLVGISAGSGSVGYHVLSPKSKGLFKRAVMMSGAPTSFWSIREPEKSIEKSTLFLDMLGCPSSNITSGLYCLKQKHPEDILEACSTYSIMAEHFIPTIDGEFIVEHPSVSVSTGKFNPGEVIMGSVADEGALFMSMAHPEFFKTSDGRLRRSEFLSVLRNLGKELSDLQLEALDVMYTDWSRPDDPLMLRDAANNFYGDKLFVCRINEFAEALTRAGNPVYRYVYDHKLSVEIRKSPAWMRAAHGQDQIPLLAPIRFLHMLGPTDKAVSRKFVKHFTNFARHGDPNLSQDEFPGEPHWPQYIHGHQYKLIRENSSIESGLRSRECAVWLNLIPLLEANKDC